MTSNAIIIFTNTPNIGSARQLAKGLVENKLAACVNIQEHLESVYCWQGKLESEPEVMLKIKTRASLFEQASAFIKHHHPYEVPEVISIEVNNIEPEYHSWLQDNTKEAN